MTPLACAGWLGGRRALPRGGAFWHWPRSMTAARAQRQPALAGSVCRRSGTVDDTKRAAEIGCTGVVLSNHGGRQLDGSRSAFDQLAEVVDAVGDQLDVI